MGLLKSHLLQGVLSAYRQPGGSTQESGIICLTLLPGSQEAHYELRP